MSWHCDCGIRDWWYSRTLILRIVLFENNFTGNGNAVQGQVFILYLFKLVGLVTIFGNVYDAVSFWMFVFRKWYCVIQTSWGVINTVNYFVNCYGSYWKKEKTHYTNSLNNEIDNLECKYWKAVFILYTALYYSRFIRILDFSCYQSNELTLVKPKLPKYDSNLNYGYPYYSKFSEIWNGSTEDTNFLRL